VLLICIQTTSPFYAQTRIQQMLPNDLIVVYCSPNDVALISTIAVLK